MPARLLWKHFISIHALREEGDLQTGSIKQLGKPFLSTPSARRATLVIQESILVYLNFYPRPPRGGRPYVMWDGRVYLNHFYPRPPRGGRLKVKPFFKIS